MAGRIWLRRGLAWIGIPALCYGSLCLLVYALQDRLVFPGAGSGAGPVQPPAGVTVGWLRRPQGERFRVAEAAPPAPRGVMVFFAGNGEDLRSGVWWARDLAAYGLHAVVAEYPGYGESQGRPSVAALLETADVTAARGAELAGDLGVPLLVGGSSLGTFCAVHLAAQGKADRLLLKSPPTSTVAAGRASFPWLPVRWLLRHRFDNLAVAGRVRCPTLVVHGDRDRIIPPAMGRELASAIAGPARLLLVPGHGHNDPSLSPSGPIAAEVRAFLDG